MSIDKVKQGGDMDLVETIPVATHCPYRQSTLIQQVLAPNKMRVGFLLGAGCPTSIEISSEKGGEPLIPAISGLTKAVLTALERSPVSKGLTIIKKRLIDGGIARPNIEDILSHIRLLGEVIGKSTIDGLTKTDLSSLDREICKAITSIVQVRLPSDMSPYHSLAKWIRSIPREHPIELFTSNYDLLMEQALENYRVPYFDGFVGSDRPFFDVASMEQDELPNRWVRLWKLHGSVNWWRNKEDNVERHYNVIDPADRQMIYPSVRKYDQTRRLPFVAMLERLRYFLRQPQSILITCGYSFSDDHLNDVIFQGLSSNPTSTCFGLVWGERKTLSSEIIKQAHVLANMSILAVDGAVIGGFEREWRLDAKTDDPIHGLAVATGDLSPRTTAPKNQCKFLLGDFKSLGNYLDYQVAEPREERGGVNGT